MQALDGQEFVSLEGDIGGGLILARDVLVAKNNPDIVSINSRIEARSVGAGSGGFSRLVRLRVHPLMKLVNPLDSVIKFTDINGDHHELRATMEFGEHTYEGTYRPNGELAPIQTVFMSCVIHILSHNLDDFQRGVSFLTWLIIL